MANTEPPKPWAATRRALAATMAEIDAALPGSVIVRHMRCGKAGCACQADPPALHGPYTQWTRSVDGKTVTRFLSQAQLARYQPWFDNARRLKELTAKLQIASVHAVEQTEGWTKPTSKASKATPPKGRSTRRSHP